MRMTAEALAEINSEEFKAKLGELPPPLQDAFDSFLASDMERFPSVEESSEGSGWSDEDDGSDYY